MTMLIDLKMPNGLKFISIFKVLSFQLLLRVEGSSGRAQENIIPTPLVIETAWLGLADLILGMTLLLKKSSSLILQCVIAVASEVTLPRLSAIFPKHSCEEGVLKTKIIIIFSRDLLKGKVIVWNSSFLAQFILKSSSKIHYHPLFLSLSQYSKKFF